MILVAFIVVVALLAACLIAIVEVSSNSVAIWCTVALIPLFGLLVWLIKTLDESGCVSCG